MTYFSFSLLQLTFVCYQNEKWLGNLNDIPTDKMSVSDNFVRMFNTYVFEGCFSCFFNFCQNFYLFFLISENYKQKDELFCFLISDSSLFIFSHFWFFFNFFKILKKI